jgi:hypothetical protein
MGFFVLLVIEELELMERNPKYSRALDVTLLESIHSFFPFSHMDYFWSFVEGDKVFSNVIVTGSLMIKRTSVG